MHGVPVLVSQSVTWRSRHHMILSRHMWWVSSSFLALPDFGQEGKSSHMARLHRKRPIWNLTLVDTVPPLQLWCVHTDTKHCLSRLQAQSRRPWANGVAEAPFWTISKVVTSSNPYFSRVARQTRRFQPGKSWNLWTRQTSDIERTFRFCSYWHGDATGSSRFGKRHYMFAESLCSIVATSSRSISLMQDVLWWWSVGSVWHEHISSW